MSTLVLGTRGSDLALTQSRWVAAQLRGLGLDVDIRVIRTEGDVSPESLSRLGGVGVFAAALRLALLEGTCDLAVHSFKDLPTRGVDGLVIAAVPRRASASDALCAAGEAALNELAPGAKVGTGSPRRAAQLRALRPDLDIVDIRGNVPTRLGRVADSEWEGPGDLDAVILALAGLERLGWGYAATDVFGPDRLLPAPAQGALAVEASMAALSAHPELVDALASLDDPWTRAAACAERAVLAHLEAGCAAPVGAWSQRSGGPEGEDILALDAAVFSLDGRRSVTAMQGIALDVSGLDTARLEEEARRLGETVGAELLALGAGDVADLQATKAPAGSTALSRAQGRDLFGNTLA